MTEPVSVRPKGSLLVGIGGGSAPEQVLIGADGSYLTANSAMPEGVEWAGNELAAVTGPASAVDGNLAAFDGATGKVLKDSGFNASDFALAAGTVVDNALVRFNGTTGDQLDQAGVTCDDANVMTFPADGGTVYSVGARKGSFTFDGSGTHTKILTAAAVTGCVLVYTIVTLGTVTAAQAILTTIDTGVGFTPVSADATDSSVVNWAIVA